MTISFYVRALVTISFYVRALVTISFLCNVSCDNNTFGSMHRCTQVPSKIEPEILNNFHLSGGTILLPLIYS